MLPSSWPPLGLLSPGKLVWKCSLELFPLPPFTSLPTFSRSTGLVAPCEPSETCPSAPLGSQASQETLTNQLCQLCLSREGGGGGESGRAAGLEGSQRE